MKTLLATALTLALPTLALATDDTDSEKDNFATLYGGQATTDTLGEILMGQVHREDTYMVGVGLGTPLSKLTPDLNLETEGVLVKYSGDQTNTEANAALKLRWKSFPWNNYVRTTASVGLGLSYAFGRPDYEYQLSGTSSRLLAYLPVEVSMAPPQSDWEGVVHIHHRSTAYGTFNSEGGANHLTLGVRKRF